MTRANLGEKTIAKNTEILMEQIEKDGEEGHSSMGRGKTTKRGRRGTGETEGRMRKEGGDLEKIGRDKRINPGTKRRNPRKFFSPKAISKSDKIVTLSTSLQMASKYRRCYRKSREESSTQISIVS